LDVIILFSVVYPIVYQNDLFLNRR